MKRNQDYKIEKEYAKNVERLDFSINARILKRKVVEGNHWDYKYEISHYCKPSLAASTIYIPGDYTGSTFEEVESKLLFYLNIFTSVGIKPNGYW